jgi:hypothetical protein
MIEPIDPVRDATTQPLAGDPVATLLDESRGLGGVLDLGQLAQALLQQPHLIGATLEQLPIVDATRLAVDMGLLRGGTLNLVTDLAPGPVADVADTVLTQTDPAADGLYKTKHEKTQVAMFESQMAAYYWDARADADLERILAPYIKGPKSPGEGRYAVEVQAVLDAIKRLPDLDPPR